MASKHIKIGRFSCPVPHSRWLRILLGTLLCMGGLLSFLPILGIWMLPLGLMMLSIDLPPVRRLRRWSVHKWAEFREYRKERAGGR